MQRGRVRYRVVVILGETKYYYRRGRNELTTDETRAHSYRRRDAAEDRLRVVRETTALVGARVLLDITTTYITGA